MTDPSTNINSPKMSGSTHSKCDNGNSSKNPPTGGLIFCSSLATCNLLLLKHYNANAGESNICAGAVSLTHCVVRSNRRNIPGGGVGDAQTEMPRRKPGQIPRTMNAYAAAARPFAIGRVRMAFRIDGRSVGWQHSSAPALIAAFQSS